MKRRSGFTITELLVAMALIIFIMAVLSEAFSAGMNAFRRLKAIGDMNERLRTATAVLRRYLAADHFDYKKRLSDADFWRNGPTAGNPGSPYSPPREGFFRIYQGS